MTSVFYLDVLEETLRTGLQGVSDQFVDAQARFVAGCQQPDGGFRGRQGDSDLYYTDFALRSLALLAPDHPAFALAQKYLRQPVDNPRSVVESFGILNVRRMLGTRGTVPFSLRENRDSPPRGLARSSGDARISAYNTFLGDLCFQMLGEPMPAIDSAIRAVESLRRPEGGYAELEDQREPQTNATAAGVAFLTMHNALSPDRAAQTVRFLSGMQSRDGGLRPHSAIGAGDLLSTFTGLVALAALGGLDAIDLSGIARFLHSTAQPSGGFIACAGDDTPDVEYAYYGVGVFALLRMSQRAG